MTKKHTLPPLVYRGAKHADWGEINFLDEEGDWVTLAKINCHLKPGGGLYSNAERDEHRRNGTDPVGGTARYIIRAVNAHEALVEAVEGYLNHNWVKGRFSTAKLFAALALAKRDPE